MTNAVASDSVSAVARMRTNSAEERAMRRRTRICGAILALSIVLAGAPITAEAQQKVLRVVPQGEVKVFDPHQTSVNLTSMHAALVYDTLFAWDADLVPRPQMVE